MKAHRTDEPVITITRAAAQDAHDRLTRVIDKLQPYRDFNLEIGELVNARAAFGFAIAGLAGGTTPIKSPYRTPGVPDE